VQKRKRKKNLSPDSRGAAETVEPGAKLLVTECGGGGGRRRRTGRVPMEAVCNKEG
jgi:hypothetical protein